MNLVEALGDGWLGKAVAAIIAAVVAWVARRPIERAGVETIFNQRISAAFTLISDAHKRCEERLTALEEKHELDQAENEQLRGQLAQEKQITASLKNLASEK